MAEAKKAELTPEEQAAADAEKAQKDLEKAWESEKLSSDDLPELLGQDFAFFIKPEYVRAKPHEDGKNYIVVEGSGDERKVSKVPVEEFDAEFVVVGPNQLVGSARYELP